MDNFNSMVRQSQLLFGSTIVYSTLNIKLLTDSVNYVILKLTDSVNRWEMRV